MSISAGLLRSGPTDDREVSFTFTADATSAWRGHERPAGAIAVIPEVTPKLDETNLLFFREFAAGELEMEEFKLSTGNWTGIKITRSLGRASNAYHFVHLDARVVNQVLETQIIVSGIALGGQRSLDAGKLWQETITYVVPREQEKWLLEEYARGPKTTERIAGLEARAFQRSLLTNASQLTMVTPSN